MSVRIHPLFAFIIILVSACDSNRPGGALREIHDVAAPTKGPFVTFEPVAALHLAGIPRNFTLNGDALYSFQNEFGLTTLDVSDPARPIVSSHLEGKPGRPTPGTHRYFSGIIDGERLLCADRAHGLAILSLADPLRPRYLSTTTLPGDQASHVAKVNATIYISAGGAGLVQAAADRIASTTISRAPVNCIFLSQAVFYPPHHLLLADSYQGGMKVLDIRDPLRPVLVRQYQFAGSCDWIEAFDGFVVVNGRQCGLIALDMSDPARPFILSHFLDGFNTVTCSTRWGERRLIVGSSSGTVDAFDLSDPRRPLWLGRTALGAPIRALAVKGDVLYAGIHQVAFSDPARVARQLRSIRLNVH